MIGRALSHLGVAVMRLLALLPLRWVRVLGAGLGHLLWWTVWPRRRVADVNLRLCFPELDAGARQRIGRRLFVHIAQSWLDRGWLWHASSEVVRGRLRLEGAVDALTAPGPAVVFVPHFVGMDAGWTALTQQLGRPLVGIYTNQSNPVVDAWVLRGRQRFAAGRPFGRADGVRGLIAALRRGELLYLLPDMNFGPEESVFVPFFGQPAATVPSLSRFARLGRARVVPVLALLAPHGYTLRVLPAWDDFPTDDVMADTARMNRALEEWIRAWPDQYYWVHKRFKTRPPGLPPVY